MSDIYRPKQLMQMILNHKVKTAELRNWWGWNSLKEMLKNVVNTSEEYYGENISNVEKVLNNTEQNESNR
jgi:hypothetical protein